MQNIGNSEFEPITEPKIYRVKITQDGYKCYDISVRHSGVFRLSDYDELEFDVSAARLVRKE